MSAFAVEQGPCGSGPARYEDGLFAWPDGTSCWIEALASVEIVPVEAASRSLQSTTGSLAETLRGALARREDAALPLPLRLAMSTVRAGLGAIEDELGEPDRVRVGLAFADRTRVAAVMARDLAERVRRERTLVRAALDRAAPSPAEAAPTPTEASPAADAPDPAPLTSIFRYEKRNGRLRRVPVADPEA